MGGKMIFSKELEKLAEEYKRSHDRNDNPKVFSPHSFDLGVKALENLIMKSGSEFDEGAWHKEFNPRYDAESFRNWEEYLIVSKEGARWQHQKDQLIIGALREEIEWRKESYSDLDDINIKLNYKIQQLEQKIKLLEDLNGE